jgi:hypothetical protein
MPRRPQHATNTLFGAGQQRNTHQDPGIAPTTQLDAAAGDDNRVQGWEGD